MWGFVKQSCSASQEGVCCTTSSVNSDNTRRRGDRTEKSYFKHFYASCNLSCMKPTAKTSFFGMRGAEHVVQVVYGKWSSLMTKLVMYRALHTSWMVFFIWVLVGLHIRVLYRENDTRGSSVWRLSGREWTGGCVYWWPRSCDLPYRRNWTFWKCSVTWHTNVTQA